MVPAVSVLLNLKLVLERIALCDWALGNG